MCSDSERLAHSLERERAARQQAESLLQRVGEQLFERSEQTRRYAAELAGQMEEMQTILDTAAEGIVTLSIDGTIYRFNRAAEEIFHCPADQAIGRTLEPYLPEIFANSEDVASRLSPSALSSSKCPYLSLHGFRADGSSFPAEVAISRWQLREKEMFTVIVRDVTQRHIVESRLTLSQKLESVGRLAAGIAHEINSPVQYVMYNVCFVRDAIQDLARLTDPARELAQACLTNERFGPLARKVLETEAEIELDYLRDEVPLALDQALEGSQRVASIVQAMREFSHPGAKSRTLTYLNAIIENVAIIARNEYKRSADLRLALNPDLPPFSGYPAEIGQVVLNLLVNAADAIEERRQRETGYRGDILVATSFKAPFIELRVTDNGPGIPREYLARIFDPFFTTKGVGKGTGQGLAICRTVIVEQHAGIIEVFTESHRGTTFAARIPLDIAP